MPTCPNGHGEKAGRYCPDCGAELIGDESINIRGAKAVATANPTFVLPGGHVDARPALVKCPWCGQRKPEHDTFDCQGECGKQNLCLRHFDEEYEVCKRCAEERRGTARQEAERQAKLRAELHDWRQRAEQAETQVAGLARQGQHAGQALESARTDLHQAQARVRSLEQELAEQRRRAEQAETHVAELARQGQQAGQTLESARADLQQAQARVRSLEQELAEQRRRAEQAEANSAALTQRSQQAETHLSQRAAELGQAQTRVQSLEKDLASWRGRAQKAEGELAAIERTRQEAEARKQAEAEATRRSAEEAKRQQPAIWQQIGIELVRIPAGETLYGDNKVKVQVPEYWIAKTPVTYLQYKAFVDATRHPAPAHWSGGRIPAGKETHPVVLVSWDDAAAFCRWAGLRLPSEQEWEKAARGTDGREYPWGSQAPTEKLCNFNQNVKYTTPVGQYPAGASPYGVLDMAGNVWEWCEDWYDTNHKYRVLRGGSWFNVAQVVRAACRLGNTADLRDTDVGFRAARSL